MDRQYKVYIHTNKINNKKYIGVTRQLPEQRWKNGKGYVRNEYFYRAIQKYGWDNFEHEVVLVNLTKEQAEMFEVEMIKYYRSNQKEFGYNIEGGGNLHKEVSEETRQKVRESKLGNKNPNFGKCGKLNPFYGKHHTEEMKEYYRKINSGNNSPWYGRKHTEEEKRKISEANKGKKFTKEHRENLSKAKKGKNKGGKNYQARKVICLEDLKTFNSIAEAGEYYNIESRDISAVCRKTRKSCHNLHFCYLEDYKNIDVNTVLSQGGNCKSIICLENNFIYKSIKQASIELNICVDGIINVLKGRKEKTKGYTFKYCKP